jgi:hypothetical protein
MRVVLVDSVDEQDTVVSEVEDTGVEVVWVKPEDVVNVVGNNELMEEGMDVMTEDDADVLIE